MDRLSMDTSSLPFVSVIVPVYNDASRLKICLGSLNNQTYPPDRYEVIVVDNGSDDDLTSLMKTFHCFKFFQERTPGPAAARNKGISRSKGSILAFTDSDCIPAYDWIKNGVERLTHAPDCGLVGGGIKVTFKQKNRQTPVELYEKIIAFQCKNYIENENHSVTANTFTLKSVVDKVGNFDVSLRAAEDEEWSSRVYAAGYKLLYADDVVVSHPARNSLRELAAKVTRLTAGFYELEKRGKRNKTLRMYLFATVQQICNVFSDRRLLGIWQKVQVVIILFFVRCIYAYERCRLTLGGRPRR